MSRAAAPSAATIRAEVAAYLSRPLQSLQRSTARHRA